GKDMVEVSGRIYNDGRFEADGKFKLTPGAYPVIQNPQKVGDVIRIGIQVNYDGGKAKAIVEIHPRAMLNDYRNLGPLLNKIGNSYGSGTSGNPIPWIQRGQIWQKR